MAAKSLDKKVILDSVLKDSNERLCKELKQAFPSCDEHELQKFSRDEIVERVLECRVFLNQTTKVNESLEGRVVINLVKEDGKPGSEVRLPVTPTSELSAMMMAMAKMFADQRQADLEREEKKELQRKEELKVLRELEEKKELARKAEEDKKELTRKAEEDQKIEELKRIKEQELEQQKVRLAFEEKEKEKDRILQRELLAAKLKDKDEKATKEKERQEEIRKEEFLRLDALRLEEQDRKKQETDKLGAQLKEEAELKRLEEQDRKIEEERRHTEIKQLLDRQMREVNRPEIQIQRSLELIRNSLGVMPVIPQEIPDWFFNLKRSMDMNKIKNEIRLPILQQLLNSKANNLLSKLSDADMATFESLQNSILREFRINSVMLNEFFQNIRKRDDETFVVLYSRMRVALVHYWRSRAIEVTTGNERVLNLILSDRIKSFLPRHLEIFVKTQELQDWLEPEKLCNLLDAYNVDLFGNKYEGNRKFGSPNFRPRESYDNNAYRGNIRGNSAPRGGVLFSRRSYRCTVCGEQGTHLASQCRMSRGQGGDVRGSWRGGVNKNPQGDFRSWLERRGKTSNRGGKSLGHGGAENVRTGSNVLPNGQVCFTCGSRYHLQSRCSLNQQLKNVHRVGMVVQNSQMNDPEKQTTRTEPILTSHVNRVSLENVYNMNRNVNSEILDANITAAVKSDMVLHPEVQIVSQSQEGGVGGKSKLVQEAGIITYNVEPVEYEQQFMMDTPKLLVKCGSQILQTLLDTGTEISVLHPDMISEFLDDEVSSRGQVKLKGPFGDSHLSDTYVLPLRLISDPSMDHYDEDTPEVFVHCAVTSKLADRRMLLSQEDYSLLRQAVDQDRQNNIGEISEMCSTVVYNQPTDDIKLNVDSEMFDNHFADDNDSLVSLFDDSNSQCNNTDLSVNILTRTSVETSDEAESENWFEKAFIDIKVDEEKSGGFANLQKMDDTLEGCRKYAEKKFAGYYFDDKTGIMFKTREFRGLRRELLVLPECKQQKVIDVCHKQGHFGCKKTKSLILRNFTFPKMKEKVAQHISSCLSCAKTRKVTKFDRIPIRQYSRSLRSWSVIALDIYGPLTITKKKNQYILGIIDLATGWVELYPLKSLHSTEVLGGVMSWISVGGVPDLLICDNGINLNSSLCLEVYKMLNLECRNSSPYHSTGNSIIERHWLTLKHLLSTLKESQYEKEWDVYLPYLLWCFRNVPNEISQYTPFELLYGHPGRSSVDVLYDIWTEKEFECPDLSKKDQKFYDDVRTKIEESVRLATKNREKNLQPYIDRYNLKAKEKTFKVGDSVLILMPSSTHKLKLKWKGPARILKVVSPGSYMVYNPQDESTHLLHANKLRKFESAVNVIGMLDAIDESLGEIIEYPITSCIEDQEKFEETLKSLDFSHLNDEQRKKLFDLLRKHSKIFSQCPGSINPEIACMKIAVREDVMPKRQQAYRIPEKLKPEVGRQLESLVKMGILKESFSQFAHPIVIVSKPDGTIRLCGDFKEINKFIIPDAYPMQRIDDLCQTIAGSNFITTLDAVKGYYQIPIHPDSRQYTAITTHLGIFEHLKTPFGISTSAQIFQRCMDKILSPHRDYARAYIDDISTFTKIDFDEHLSKLDKVLYSIGSAGMTLNLKKCKFGRSKIDFLGFLVGNGTISPNPNKLKIISELKEPSSKKEIRSFLAMCRFYMRHLPNFSDIAVPLSDLTRDSVRGTFCFTEEQRNAFLKLKGIILEAQTLYVPDYDQPFYMVCDSSEFAIAGSLNQKDSGGNMRPIEFVSKKLSKSQLSWSVIEKELYSILYSLQRFDHFVLGCPIFIISDHRPLIYLSTNMANSSRLTRWSLCMNRWSPSIQHEPGVTNAVDYLTRKF